MEIPDEFRFTVARDPSGLYAVTSDDEPGLLVVHADHDGALAMLPRALRQIREANAAR